MFKSAQYLVAKIVPDTTKSAHKGIVRPLAEEIKHYLQSNGAEGLVRVSSDSSAVYVQRVSSDSSAVYVHADPAASKIFGLLQSYQAHRDKGAKFNVKLERNLPKSPSTTKDTGGYQQRIKDLEAQLTEANRRGDALEGDLAAAEELYDDGQKALSEKYRGSREKNDELLQQITSLGSNCLTDAGGLEGLAKNASAYHAAQEKIFHSAFQNITNSIEGRTLISPVEGVEEAKETLENRAFYLTETGKETLKGLPSSAIEAAQNEWKQAEETVAKHNKYLKKNELAIPIRISNGEEGIEVTLPVYWEAEGEVSQLLAETLEKYRDVLRSMEGKSSTRDTEKVYLNISTAGKIDYATLEKSLVEHFNKSLATYNIKVETFRLDAPYTPESISSFTAAESSTFSEWLQARMDSEGIENANQLAHESGLTYGAIKGILSGSKPTEKSREKIAKALGISLDEIKDVFSKFY
jgi:hypothetical protein